MNGKKSLSVLLLFCLILFLRCGKEEPRAEPIPEVPLTAEEMIMGEWMVEYSVLAWSGDTVMQDTTGVEKTWHFWSSDSVNMAKYIKEMDTVLNSACSYKIVEDTTNRGGSQHDLELNWGSSTTRCWMKLNQNTLILDFRSTDEPYIHFTKKIK